MSAQERNTNNSKPEPTQKPTSGEIITAGEQRKPKPISVKPTCGRQITNGQKPK